MGFGHGGAALNKAETPTIDIVEETKNTMVLC